jgi:hypothetical protein
MHNLVRQQTKVIQRKTATRSLSAFFLLLLNCQFFSLTAVAQNKPKDNPLIFENPTISPGFTPDPLTVKGIGGGKIPANEIAGTPGTNNGSCVGFADKEPDHVLTLNNFFDYLSLRVRSDSDTTLVIKGPGGVWCNDDYDASDKNAGIAGQWKKGAYQIWVGSYSKDIYPTYIIELSQKK